MKLFAPAAAALVSDADVPVPLPPSTTPPPPPHPQASSATTRRPHSTCPSMWLEGTRTASWRQAMITPAACLWTGEPSVGVRGGRVWGRRPERVGVLSRRRSSREAGRALPSFSLGSPPSLQVKMAMEKRGLGTRHSHSLSPRRCWAASAFPLLPRVSRTRAACC